MMCDCNGTGICQECMGECIVNGQVCEKCEGTGKCICKKNKSKKQRQENQGWFSWM